MSEEKLPKISVIIPVHNAELYLDDCLTSVEAQDFEDFEVLMVDDHSCDSSAEIMQIWQEEDSRFHVFTSADRGVSAARNKGLIEAKGEIITFADADDELAEHCFSRAVREDWNGADIFMGSSEKVRGDKVEFFGLRTADGVKTVTFDGDGLVDFEKKTLSNGRWESFPLNHAMTSVVWGKFYRRELLGGLFFREDMDLGEDTVFMLDCIERLKEKGGSVVVTSDVCYRYFVRERSLAGSASASSMRERTERLLFELMHRYGDHEEMRPYLTEKFVQQLLHFLESSWEMQDTGISMSKKAMYLRKMLSREPWKKVLKPGCERHLPGNSFDKGLAFLVGREMYAAALSWTAMRARLKK